MNHEDVKKWCIEQLQNATEENHIEVNMIRQVIKKDNGEMVEARPGPAKILIEIYLPE